MGPEHGVRWESDGQGEYSLEVVTQRARGTEVILHLREGEDDLAVGLSGCARSSASIPITSPIPILMKKEEWDKDKNEQVIKDEDEQINQASALWTRPKSEVTDEQYQEFYKHVAHDFERAAGLGPRPRRRQAGVHAAALRAGACAVRPVGPRAPARRASCTCSASSSWTTPSS